MQNHDDGEVVYLFEEDGTTLRAIARDDVGVNLPDSESGWRFVRTLKLVGEQVLSLGTEIEAVVTGIQGFGYHLWDTGTVNAPVVSYPRLN